VLEERMAESRESQNVLKDLLEKSKTSCIKKFAELTAFRQKNSMD
jgi:hypothetical protein